MVMKLEYVRIKEEDSFRLVQNRVCGKTTKRFIMCSHIRNYGCSFDDSRLYQFQFSSTCSDGKTYTHSIAFVRPSGIARFLERNKKYAKKIGYDPLSFGDYDEVAEIFVFSPKRFPKKELGLLHSTGTFVTLMTTHEIIRKYRFVFEWKDETKKLRRERNNVVIEEETEEYGP